MIDADLHFYPGSGQHRALVGVGHYTEPGPFPPPGSSLAEIRAQFAGLLAADPWAGRMPALARVAPVLPAESGQPWALVDEAGETCGLDEAGLDPWTLLAQSCGDLVTVFGEWHGSRLLPLAVLADAVAREPETPVRG